MNWTSDQLKIHEMKRGIKAEKPSNAAIKEADLHAEITAECKRRGWICFHSRMDRKSTLTKGTPDFVILMECGNALFVEAKAKAGKLSNEQIGIKLWGQRLGHTIHVVYSLDQFLQAIEIEKGTK